MKVAGVVCEYNPFHLGHQYHLQQTRAAGADAVVAVMSGNFVQRGEGALVDKWSRAAAAVQCGVDLVLDLPVPWATGSAENFASGAVFLLGSIGVDLLSFGSETADLAALQKLAAAVSVDAVRDCVKTLTAAGAAYPAALQSALEEHCGDAATQLLRGPNNVLALEYLKAAEKFGISLDFLPVQRVGAAHDAVGSTGGFMSAAAIRALENIDDARTFIPQGAFQRMFADRSALFCTAAFETALLTTLRRMDDAALKQYVDDRSGLADRIAAARKTACTLPELYAAAKTKSITMAKVKRELLHVFLGVEPAWAMQTPPYLRVLAANRRGLALLGRACISLPVVTKHAEAAALDGFSQTVYALQCRSTDLYHLCLQERRPCGEEQRRAMELFPDC